MRSLASIFRNSGLSVLVATLVATAAFAQGGSAEAVADAPSGSVGTGAPSVLNLPQMGEPADAALSPAQEAQIGASVIAQLYQYDYILEDPELTDYMTSIGWRLVAAASQKPPHLEVFVVRDPRINAFALPGGYVAFNAGLLIASQSESEVAGVMGHELTHVTQRHIARSQADMSGIGTFATWAAVLAAIIAGSANPDLVLAALAVGQGTLYQKQVNFTRANELEADRIGIQTMADAGFDPQGMASFFQRLEQQSRLYGTGVPDILRTHPVNTVRIAEAQARAAAMKPRSVTDPIEYPLMRERSRVLTFSRPTQGIEYYAAELKAGHDTPGNRYGLALSMRQSGDYSGAAAILQPLLDRNPKQPNIALLMADIKVTSGKQSEGLALYKKTLDTYPRLTPVILDYAQALILSGKSEEARQLLLSSEQAYGTRLETYRLLALAARDAGDIGMASYEMANYLYFRGDYGGALAQLDAGLRLDSLSQQDRARMAARRAEVREALPRNYNPYARDEQRR
jgi:predicted Zn-dependent protease